MKVTYPVVFTFSTLHHTTDYYIPDLQVNGHSFTSFLKAFYSSMNRIKSLYLVKGRPTPRTLAKCIDEFQTYEPESQRVVILPVDVEVDDFEEYTCTLPSSIVKKIIDDNIDVNKIIINHITGNDSINDNSDNKRVHPVTIDIVKKYLPKVDFQCIRKDTALLQMDGAKPTQHHGPISCSVIEFMNIGLDVVVQTDEVGKFYFTVVYNDTLSNGLIYKDRISVETKLTMKELHEVLLTRVNNASMKIVLGTPMIELNGIKYPLIDFMNMCYEMDEKGGF